MIVTVTAKIKIKPTQAHAEALLETVSAYRKGCNLVSSLVFITKQLKQPALHQITYNMLRSTIGLRSQMSQSAMKTVIARYKTNQSNGHDWTQVQFKQPEYDLVWNRDYSLTSGLFSVNTLQGRIKVPFERKAMEAYFDGSWMFRTAKLVRKHHKWFLHIPMSKQMTEPHLEEMTQIVGIDLGINFLATAYDTQGKTIFFPGRAIKRKRAKYKQMRQQLQKKQTPSARRKLKQMGQRETRWMTDVNHAVSKALVSRYGAKTLFVLEDLTGVRNVTEKVKLKDRYVSVSWAFHQLRKMVEYKAQLAGSRIIAVDPKYTSQQCPLCNHKEKANRDKIKHHFCCRNCGYQSNDDRIAAMNLLAKGKKYLEEGTSIA
ncbi:RNA-guided endonuclease InsQ/TnpB family protein [Cohnella silvisoli]|uniref:Transposase n=1 Tax=Cohnella silvisoli TaxID=2873699 RepID=A0ABV1KQP6_9BACL|nr:transposase [Cohnella silvisoli]MCD9022143.1 transposase [Cohnella silvisoli]